MASRTGATPATNLPVELHSGKPPMVAVPPGLSHVAALAWLEDRRTAIRTELLRHGSVLLRGLPVRESGQFAEIRDLMVERRASYREKATPRSDYGADIYSSTDLPPMQSIRLHNENSYTLEFPGTLLFCCLVAPTEGGATTVADVRRVLADLPADLVGRFRRHGWLLTRNYHSHVGLPWPTAFGTTSPAKVETYCERNLIGCTWTGDSGLRTVQRRSSIVRHPITGEEVWFNHVAFWSRWSLDEEIREVLETTYGEDGLPFDTAYGNGTAIAPNEVDVLNAAYDRATMRDSWRSGDVLLVDNILAAHGRDAFRGDRSILVAMGDPVPLDACSPTVSPTRQL
ncbi:TauD/TfdA family dioxygenase [Streptomyces violaceusniger]